MNGLKQIQVVGDARAWNVIGLDEQGVLWFGAQRSEGSHRYAVTWTRIHEDTTPEYRVSKPG
jgi:hypothetical protein